MMGIVRSKYFIGLLWYTLRIDKGSRAVRCVIVRSGGTIHSTVIL